MGFVFGRGELKNILFFAEGIKMRRLISMAYHEGIDGVYLLTKYGPKI